jgi:hypothetical protein
MQQECAAVVSGKQQLTVLNPQAVEQSTPPNWFSHPWAAPAVQGLQKPAQLLLLPDHFLLCCGCWC